MVVLVVRVGLGGFQKCDCGQTTKTIYKVVEQCLCCSQDLHHNELLSFFISQSSNFSFCALILTVSLITVQHMELYYTLTITYMLINTSLHLTTVTPHFHDTQLHNHNPVLTLCTKSRTNICPGSMKIAITELQLCTAL